MKTEERFYTKLARLLGLLRLSTASRRLQRKLQKRRQKIMSSVQSKVNRLASKVVEKSKKIEEEDWTDF